MSSESDDAGPVVVELVRGAVERHPTASEWQMLRAMALEVTATVHSGQPIQVTFHGFMVRTRRAEPVPRSGVRSEVAFQGGPD